jgi:hypothetical protein
MLSLDTCRGFFRIHPQVAEFVLSLSFVQIGVEELNQLNAEMCRELGRDYKPPHGLEIP